MPSIEKNFSQGNFYVSPKNISKTDLTMSTFFEKLTGTNQKISAADPIDFAGEETEDSKKPVRRSAPPREKTEPRGTHHLKVEAEHARTATPEEPAEEEGELTVDIYDKGDSIVIQSTVAGVKPDDLDVAITNDTVTIRGRREQQEEVEEENYYYKELFWGGFSRTVILPEEVEEDMAEAVLKHGLLTIRLPKKKRGVVQKLKVRVT